MAKALLPAPVYGTIELEVPLFMPVVDGMYAVGVGAELDGVAEPLGPTK